MGYTHYWRSGRISKAAWASIEKDSAALLAASPVKLAFEYDEPTKPPICDDKQIRFNGVGKEGHETFWLAASPQDFEFCKTASKPYDLIVVAILAVAAEYAGESIQVSSDGTADDWSDGVEWASKILGRTIPNPISETA